MVQPKPTFKLASLFEQRARQIDAERRSASQEGPSAPAPPTGAIWHHVMEDEGRPAYILEMQDQTMLRSVTPESSEWESLLAEVVNAPVTMAVSDDAEAGPDKVEPLLSKTRELLAVSGRVDPNDFILEERSDETLQLALSNLASECSVETHQGKVQWLYSKDPRNKMLQRLVEEGRLQAVLNGPLPPTDRFGEMLRALLRQGAALSFTNLPREELIDLKAAIEATDRANIPHPDLAEITKLVSRKEFLSEYDVLLSRGFSGRHDELKELREFLLVPGAGRGQWTSMVLTGPGGSGKSTLLAKFSRDVVKEKLATIVILDFDRPGIDPKDRYWMEQEISRQVGDQYSPEAAEYLSQRRREERIYRETYVDAVTQSSAMGFEEARSSRTILVSVDQILFDEGAHKRPFLLVLDTYEQIEDQDLSSNIFDWLYDLASLFSSPFKVIFSGRLYDENLTRLQTHSDTKILQVDELAPQDAHEVLLNNGVSEAIASRLVSSNVIPLRPLELTLLAKITSDQNKTIDELEDELREGGDSAKELFAGLVYKRVLCRLGDPVAQQLAYPGLVLRYVTVDLIRFVLAPALELPPFDEAQASKALDALASCSWLVSRDNEKVWHRKDLRRSTLKAMISAEPENARKISEVAVKYFQQQQDEKARAEAVYHRLMLMRDPADGEEFELAELKRANDHISTAIGDLPSYAATLLKFAVEGKVAPAEVECLPLRYLDRGYSEAGKELVNARLFGKALKLYERRHDESAVQNYATAEDWEVETLFATGCWDRLKFATNYRALRGSSVLNQLSKSVYPALIVSPEPFSNYAFDLGLPAIIEDADYLKQGLTGAEGPENVRKLVVSSIYVVAEGNDDQQLVFANAISAFSRRYRGARSESLPPVTERRMMLLERVFHIDLDDSEATFSINTLPLDSEWITEFRKYLPQYGAQPEALLGLMADVQRILNDPPPPRTLRTVLSYIASASKEEGIRRGSELKITSEINEQAAWHYLRGPSPEFRDPCRFALLDAFPDRPSLHKLSEIFASLIHVNAQDLQPDVFVDTVSADPEHALAVYVEFVDRNWALGDLMSEARKHSSSPKLNQVADGFNRWNNALRATINKGFSLNPSDRGVEGQSRAANE